MTTAERTYANPLYAAVGVGDLAYTQVNDRITEFRTRTEAAAGTATAKIGEAQAKFGEAKSRIEALPTEVPASIEELRGKLTVEELRKLADPYVAKVTEFYNSLAERGEGTVERLRQRPVVAENISRAEKAYSDAVEITEDALGVVSTQTKLVGERAAKLAGMVGVKSASTESNEAVSPEVVDAEVVEAEVTVGSSEE